jgi:hypothetical protein
MKAHGLVLTRLVSSSTSSSSSSKVPYNQPGPALDMLNRFLKGKDFYDRPLVTFSSYPMPDEPLQGSTVNSSQTESTVMEEMQMSATFGMPTLPNTKNTTGLAIGLVSLIALTAFVLGVWVARMTMAVGVTANTSSGRSSEQKRLMEGEHYGSI